MANTRPNKHIDQGQTWLTKTMQFFKYPSAAAGVCFGVSFMAAQAILVGDLAVFDARLVEIYELSKSALLSSGALIELDVNIAALFNGIELLQQPHLYKDVLNRTENIAQRASTVWQFTASKELEQLGGFAEVGKFTGAYTRDELYDYLESLRETLHQQKEPTPLAMVVRSHAHAITITYDQKSKEWVLIDIENAPSKRFRSSRKMTEAMQKAFGGSHTSILSTAIYAAGDHVLYARKLMADWQKQAKLQSVNALTPAKLAAKDSSNATLLGMAVATDDFDTMKKVLAARANVNAASANGMTPLYLAVERNDEDAVRYLLNHGAQIDKAKVNGETPLMQAARFGHADMIELLISHGAAIDAQRRDGSTALYLAAHNSKTEAVHMLTKYKANPNIARHDDQLTPLHIAAWRGDQTNVTTLLHAGAKVNNNIIRCASECGHKTIEKQLKLHGSRAFRLFKKAKNKLTTRPHQTPTHR